MILDKADAKDVVISDCRYGRMMHFAHDKYIGHALIAYGEYSESEVEHWRALLPEDAIVVDAGANIGAHTIALARLVPKGLVFAFEPLRTMFNMLCGNLALNGITNVVPIYGAAGAERGQIIVPGIDYTQDGNYGGVALGGFQAGQGNQVAVFPLDAVLPRVSFIKADVEGMEKAVLQGAKGLIQQHRPILYLENNPSEDGRERDLIDYVHSIGYDCWWHLAPHYNPDNFRGNPTNDYENIVSYNMVCLPAHPDTRALMGIDPILTAAQMAMANE